MPKKMAHIALRRDGPRVDGWVERHGVRFCEMRARLTGAWNAEDAKDVVVRALSGARQDAFRLSSAADPTRDRISAAVERGR
jgi:hypothetical protein